MATIQRIEMIATDPAVRGGRPCIVGTGLRVTDVAIAHLFHGRTPGELASDYGIPLAEVHAALAYYYAHKAELDEDIRQQVTRARTYREGRVGGKASLLP
jgi:uncharacterized protein (DUF433 family)